MPQSFHLHDCEDCHYLGPWGIENGDVSDVEDLYIHIRHHGCHDLVHRYGSHSDDYCSRDLDIVLTLRAMGQSQPVYEEIILRAQRRGLI